MKPGTITQRELSRFQCIGDQPFVAPDVRPRMNSFCAIRNTKIDGARTITANAYSAPVVSSMYDRKRASPSGSVCMFGSRVIRSGHRKLFHDQMNVRITLVAIAGFDNGNSTRTMIRHSDNPSMRAASISDFG